MNWLNSLADGEKVALGTVASIVAVTVIAPLVNHWLAMRRERRTATRDAAANFRTTLVSGLKGLYPSPANWPDNEEYTLRKIFPAIQAAVTQFRPFVSLWRRQAFDDAWVRYWCGTDREKDGQCYFHYMAFESNSDPKGNFKRNVDVLLSFANKL